MDKKAKLKDLLTKLKAEQAKFTGETRMTKEQGEALEAMVAEAELLQAEVDKDERIKKLDDGVKVIPSPAIPADETPEQKAAREAREDLERKAQLTLARPKYVGYLRLGQWALGQKAFGEARRLRFPHTQLVLASGIKDLRQGFIGVTAGELEEMKQTVPTIGEGVIEPTRIPELVRLTEHDKLVLRDILNVSQTSSNAVKFTRLTNYSRGAAAVAHGAKKPSATLTLDTVIEPVRKIAVYVVVEDEQLDDYPALSGIINGELLYDLGKHEEELIMYGSGAGEEFNGLLVNPLILQCGNGLHTNANPAGRVKASDTLIDVIRRGITDVLAAGYTPNGIALHPFDWEDILLQKGTDKRYVWVVVADGANMRLWALPVIETMAMQDFQGVETEERNLLVGDFQRGAVLWDRQDAAVSIGWTNEQFIENKRTILGEWRGAFGTWRPGAFRKWRTQEASAS